MGDVGELSNNDLTFLEPYLPSRRPSAPTGETVPADSSPACKSELPFVTLTYASSLDSMIALAVGARTTLSGVETKRMTHYLRLRHDAILIGTGTAIVDDPGLNCRYSGAKFDDQPRPVIIDPQRRWPYHNKKAFELASRGEGKGPWIVSQIGEPSQSDLLDAGGEYLTIESRVAGPKVAGTPDIHGANSMPWHEILTSLKRKGIDSVMIEGGARVINTLLHMPDLVDSVIITIAPTWLGRGGVEVQPAARAEHGNRVNSAWLQNTSWRQFGDDVVLCGKLSLAKTTERLRV